MANEKDLTQVFNSLDTLLENVDISDVTAESSTFSELPDGFYLSEVEKAELTVSKSSGEPMVAFKFKTIEDGLNIDEDANLTTVKKTKNKSIKMYYVLKNGDAVRRFVTDMLKFEGEKEGEPILGKEYFTNSALLVDALDILVGMRLYVQSSTTKNDDDSTSNWKNLISWKRAKALGLPL